MDRWRYPHRGGVQRPARRLAPEACGKTMRFTGTTILKVQDGLITEEIGLDDGVSVLKQLDLIADN